jgi:hypothetical protein
LLFRQLAISVTGILTFLTFSIAKSEIYKFSTSLNETETLQ